MNRVPNFTLPSAEKLSYEIDSILDGFLSSKMSHLKSQPFAISFDIATTKSMAASFLGMTVHFLDKYFNNNVFALAIEQLGGRHTNELIRDSASDVLEKYGFNLDDVSAFVTDGAGNMKKAFRFGFV